MWVLSEVNFHSLKRIVFKNPYDGKVSEMRNKMNFAFSRKTREERLVSRTELKLKLVG